MLVGTGLALASAAPAQDSGGLLLTFGIETQLRYDDNPGLDDPSQGGSTILDNKLSFRLSSETHIDSLNLIFNGNIPFSDASGSSNGLDDTQLNFSYERRGSRSLLNLTAGYTRSDLTLLGPLEGIDETDNGPVVIGVDEATRIDTSVGLRFETGIDQPLRFTLEANHSERGFENTVDPDLIDSTTDRLTLGLQLMFSPTLTGGIRATTQRYSAEDADNTVQRTDTVSLSVDYAIDATTGFSASLGQTRVSTDKVFGTTNTEGFNGSLSLMRQLPTGSIGLSYARTVSSNGGRDTLNLSRDYEMPTGALSFRIGASQGTSGAASLVGQVSYKQELKRGQMNFGLTRSVSTDADGDDVLSTRLSAGAVYDFNAVSSLNFQTGYARVEDGGVGTVSVGEQLDASLSLQRQITPDWALSAGYKYRSTHKEGGTSADSNALFVSIGRQFTFRP